MTSRENHQRRSAHIGVGLLGMGVVGTGVPRVLTDKRDQLTAKAGRPLSLKRILVRDRAKSRGFEVPPELFTTNVDDILNDPMVDVVVAVIGGHEPAHSWILGAISAGKHVVTANKEVMARHGREILALAAKKRVRVLFEASVGGGTPIIGPPVRDLAANKSISIRGIINGTTNYILTRMARNGVDFDDALREAQELGYAEADPTSDVEGTDASFDANGI